MAKIILNQASINYNYMQGTTTVANNVQTNVVDTLVSDVKIVIQKTVCATYFKPGDKLTYSISVANVGDAPSVNTVVYDNLVSQDYIDGSTSVTLNGQNYTGYTVGNIINEQGITNGFGWNLGTLPGNSVAIITFKVTPDENQDTIKNKAVSYHGPAVAAGETRTNETSNETTVTKKYADLEVNKIANENVNCGDDFSYVITLRNNGNEDAINANITDVLPAIFVIPATGAVTVNGTGATYTLVSATNTITIPIGTVAPGETGIKTVVISGKIVCA